MEQIKAIINFRWSKIGQPNGSLPASTPREQLIYLNGLVDGILLTTHIHLDTIEL